MYKFAYTDVFVYIYTQIHMFFNKIIIYDKMLEEYARTNSHLYCISH
jgi:hypothetical protein